MSDTMIDRESVIRQLTQHIARADYIETDWMDCVSVPMLRGALELLKEQLPRVLTLEEVESSQNSVWLERNMPEWETPIAVLVDKVGKYLDTFIAIGGLCFQGEKSHGQEYGDYGKTWRCWSSRPTDEQREAVPWTE